MSWIKMSERKPEVGQRVLLWDNERKDVVVGLVAHDNWHASYNHWQPFTVEPPISELTQLEKDEAAAITWDKSPMGYSLCGGSPVHRLAAFRAGIAYERAEIAKLLGDTPIHTAVNFSALVQRVKGGAA